MATAIINESTVKALQTEHDSTRDEAVANARLLSEYQKDCAVCGNGMVIMPWGDVTLPSDRLTITVVDGNGDEHRVQVHRGCFQYMTLARLGVEDHGDES